MRISWLIYCRLEFELRHERDENYCWMHEITRGVYRERVGTPSEGFLVGGGRGAIRDRSAVISW